MSVLPKPKGALAGGAQAVPPAGAAAVAAAKWEDAVRIAPLANAALPADGRRVQAGGQRVE